MRHYSVSIGPCSAFISTPVDLLGELSARNGAPPSSMFMVRSVSQPSKPLVEHLETGGPASVDYRPEDRHLQIRCAAKDIGVGTYLLHYAHLLLEGELQISGFVTAHAAAVRIGDNGVLLLGKTGAGKSTTAIKVCQGGLATLIGNDLCVLGLPEIDSVPTVIGGTKEIALRLLAVQQNMPEFLGCFGDAQSGDPWTTKLIVEAEQLGIKTCEEITPIRSAFFVHVDSHQSLAYEADLNPLLLKLFLFENFSRYIRCLTTPVLLGEGYRLGPYLPSLDSPMAYDRRVHLIEHLCDRIGVRYLSGRASDVAQRVHDIAGGGQTATVASSLDLPGGIP